MPKPRRKSEIHSVKHGRVKLFLKLEAGFQGQDIDPKSENKRGQKVGWMKMENSPGKFPKQVFST